MVPKQFYKCPLSMYMAGVAMRMLVLTLLIFKKVKLIFGHPVSNIFHQERNTIDLKAPVLTLVIFCHIFSKLCVVKIEYIHVHITKLFQKHVTCTTINYKTKRDMEDRLHHHQWHCGLSNDKSHHCQELNQPPFDEIMMTCNSAMLISHQGPP